MFQSHRYEPVGGWSKYRRGKLLVWWVGVAFALAVFVVLVLVLAIVAKDNTRAPELRRVPLEEAHRVDAPRLSPMVRVRVPEPEAQYFDEDPLAPLPEPLCVDGSEGIYYFRPSSVRDSRDRTLRWVIHLGGSNLAPSMMGWDADLQQPISVEETLEDDVYNPGIFTCHDLASCSSKPTFSSSDTLPQEVFVHGLLSPDSETNPDFFDANHVFIPYCSGDLWLGNAKQGSSLSIFPRGRDLLDGVITDLLAHGMQDAREILVSGTNEGGLGVVYHIDRLRSALPHTAYVMALNDGGLLFDHLNFDDQTVFKGFPQWGAAPCEEPAQSSEPGAADARFPCNTISPEFDSQFIGDGHCDDVYNVPPCFDGGDCCAASCTDRAGHPCQNSVFHCIDPRYLEGTQFNEAQATEQLTRAQYSCYIGWEAISAVDTPMFLTLSQSNHFQLGSMGVDITTEPTLKERGVILRFIELAFGDLVDLVVATHTLQVAVEQKFREELRARVGERVKAFHSGARAEEATNSIARARSVASAIVQAAQQQPSSVKKSLDGPRARALREATGPTDPAPGFGVELGHLWRTPIPMPRTRLGVWAPICRHMFGVLSIRAFKEGEEVLVGATSLREAFGNFYFGWSFSTDVPEHASPPNGGLSVISAAGETHALSQGVLRGGSRMAVSYFVEHATNCTRCLTELSERAMAALTERSELMARTEREFKERAVAARAARAARERDGKVKKALDDSISRTSGPVFGGGTPSIMEAVQSVSKEEARAARQKAVQSSRQDTRPPQIPKGAPSVDQLVRRVAAKQGTSEEETRAKIDQMLKNIDERSPGMRVTGPSQLFVGQKPTVEQDVEQTVKGDIKKEKVEELRQRADKRHANAQSKPPTSQTPNSKAPNSDNNANAAKQREAVLKEKERAQANMGKPTEAKREVGMGKPGAGSLPPGTRTNQGAPAKGKGKDGAGLGMRGRGDKMTEVQRQQAKERQQAAAQEYARLNMGKEEIKEHQVVPVRVVADASDVVPPEPAKDEEDQDGKEEGDGIDDDEGEEEEEQGEDAAKRPPPPEAGLPNDMGMGGGTDGSMGGGVAASASANADASKELLERLAFALHAFPPMEGGKLVARVGQESVFCIRNPLQRSVDASSVQGFLQHVDDNKVPQFPIAVTPGINANPDEVVRVEKTGEARLFVTTSALCAIINVVVPGPYLASIQVHSAANNVAPLHILGSPFEVLVEPGPFDATAALVEQESSPVHVNPKTHKAFHTIRVVARDRFENVLNHGGDSVYARYVGPRIELTTVTDHRNGTYTLHTTLSDEGEYRIDVLLLRARHPTKHFTPAKSGVRGKHIAQSPYRLDVRSKDHKRSKPKNFVPCTLSNTDPNNPLWSVAGSWVHKQTLEPTHPDWAVAVNSTYFGQYRWVYESCLPRIVTPALSETCLANQWVHVIGDGTSRDLYRLMKALLVTAKQKRAPLPSVPQQLNQLVSPFAWWNAQVVPTARSTKFSLMGYKNDRQPGRSLSVYHYKTEDRNVELTWSPFRDTAFDRSHHVDVFSQLRLSPQQPTAVVVSLSAVQLCDVPHDEFLTYLHGLIHHAKASFQGRTIWLIPPAVHDAVYHERFRKCSYDKIKRRADILKTSLGSGAEIVDLWQMSAGRPDATSDGARYVWATDPEPVAESVRLDLDTDTSSVFFKSGVDGFVGPVGWSMANLLLNHLCADALNLISPVDAAKLEFQEPPPRRGYGLGAWVAGLLALLGVCVLGLHASKQRWLDPPHEL